MRIGCGVAILTLFLGLGCYGASRAASGHDASPGDRVDASSLEAGPHVDASGRRQDASSWLDAHDDASASVRDADVVPVDADVPLDAGAQPEDGGDPGWPLDAHRLDALSPSLDAAEDDAGASDCAVFVTNVVSHRFGTGQSFNQHLGFPDVLYGPPVSMQPRSVVSLGNGGEVVVEFANNAIVDGPGIDFIVFENPLPGFVELATVAVSDDGATWHSFPCTASEDDVDLGACAGVEIVRSSPANGIDPRDPAVAGGDLYDLADLGVARARYVRIIDRADLDGPSGVFDLDAVAIVNAECVPPSRPD